MPVILKIAHPDGQRSAVWEITEDEYALHEMASLSKEDEAAYSLITNQGRRMEWLAVRILLKQLYSIPPAILYEKNGRPALSNCTDKISISHSGTMVAIALHPNQTPGIDIERVHPRIRKIAERFLGYDEKKYLGKPHSLEQLTTVWGAKEVLFKVYENGGIEFKDDFLISPFKTGKKGKLDGHITKGIDNILIPMEFIQIGDYVLVQTDYPQIDFEKKL